VSAPASIVGSLGRGPTIELHGIALTTVRSILPPTSLKAHAFSAMSSRPCCWDS